MSYDQRFIDRVFRIVDRVEAEGDALDLPPEAEKKLTDLYEQRRGTHLSIIQYVADQLGLGAIQSLGDQDLENVVRDASDAIDAWEEHDNEHPGGTSPSAPLQKLLAEHLKICDRMLDIQDQIVLARTRVANPRLPGRP
jgi:hypothetical protein